jgi:hypothetical protein
MSQADEIAVVDDSDLPLELLILFERPEQLSPLFANIAWQRLDRTGPAEVVGQLPAQGRHLLDPVAGCRQVECRVRAGPEGVAHELADEPWRDEAGGPFHSDVGAELAEQAVGEAVIGGDLHGPEIGRRPHGLDPLPQLLGGLVRERDPEGGVDLAGVEQPGEPECHRGGLAGTGPGVDPQWLEREVDDRLLLGAGLDTGHD